MSVKLEEIQHLNLSFQRMCGGFFHQPNLKNVLVRLDHFLGPMCFLDGSYLRTLNRVSGCSVSRSIWKHIGNTFHQEVEQRVVCWNMMGLENYYDFPKIGEFVTSVGLFQVEFQGMEEATKIIASRSCWCAHRQLYPPAMYLGFDFGLLIALIYGKYQWNSKAHARLQYELHLTLRKTNDSPLKIGRAPPKKRLVSQARCFRCKLAVSLREGHISTSLQRVRYQGAKVLLGRFFFFEHLQVWILKYLDLSDYYIDPRKHTRGLTEGSPKWCFGRKRSLPAVKYGPFLVFWKFLGSGPRHPTNRNPAKEMYRKLERPTDGTKWIGQSRI